MNISAQTLTMLGAITSKGCLSYLPDGGEESFKQRVIGNPDLFMKFMLLWDSIVGTTTSSDGKPLLVCVMSVREIVGFTPSDESELLYIYGMIFLRLYAKGMQPVLVDEETATRTLPLLKNIDSLFCVNAFFSLGHENHFEVIEMRSGQETVSKVFHSGYVNFSESSKFAIFFGSNK